MNRMRTLTKTLAAMAAFAAPLGLSAQDGELLAYENFGSYDNAFISLNSQPAPPASTGVLDYVALEVWMKNANTTVVNNSLTYGSLAVSGKRLSIPDLSASGPDGGGNIAGLNRAADGPFADYITGEGARIGSVKGTSIWLSFLFRLDPPWDLDEYVTAVNQLPPEYPRIDSQILQSFFGLVRQLQPWGEPNADSWYPWGHGQNSYWNMVFRIGNWGANSSETSVYRFENNFTDVELSEDVRLAVVRIDFNETGQDVATFWMDPDPETLELGEPVGTHAADDLAFDGFYWKTQIHHIELDEIRFGTTAEAVLPQAASYAFDIQIEGEGSVTATPEAEDGTYFENSTVQLQALPAEGWVFDGWSGDVGSADVNSPTISIIVTDNAAITATFEQLASYSYTISVQPEGAGLIEGSPESPVLEGSEVEFLSVASGDLVFDRFEANGVSYTTNPVLIEITADTDVVAYFVPGNVAGFLTGLISTGEANRPWNSPWLGDVLVEFFPWVYNDLGWLYLDTSTSSDAGLWYYDFGLGWCFSGTAYTPFFYVFELEAWGFSFSEEQDGTAGRWIGLYNEEGTIGDNDWLWLPLSAPAE